ncbi:MAG TPA: Rieske 2Fe-2S domain-containing protein [Anaerolineae bacterium]|nr:Rieske 2Fe-2S domain-containing protein [Anaerolineae bacterium]
MDGNRQSAVSHQPSAMARRDFLALFGRGALWATAGVTVVVLLRYLSFTEPTPPQIFVLNEPSAYPLDSTTPVADGRAFIKHDERGLYAINATCTHLGCLVKQSATGFDCPCHGSRYTANGAVTNGPAIQPLNYAAVSLDSSGKVMLDLSHAVDSSARLVI